MVFLSQKVDGSMIFTDYWKFLFWPFREWEVRFFLSQKVDGKMIFTDYWKVLVLNFSLMGNTVFFESRSWWKDDIYWLFRSSCFELFGDGKYCLFSAKTLMERWYILDLFELSMIFRDLGNMVFRAVKLVSTTRSHLTRSARNYLLFVPNYNSVRF